MGAVISTSTVRVLHATTIGCVNAILQIALCRNMREPFVSV